MSKSTKSAFAVLTPPGRGGIAVVRCAGPAAAAAMAQCFRPARQTGTVALPPPGALAYGHILDVASRPLDEVILHCESPTAFEVNCHGGPAAVRAVCDRLAELGLAPTDADGLMELEGVPRLARDARQALRGATTETAARILLDQLGGALAEALAAAQRDLAAGRAAEATAAVDAMLDRWRTCGRRLADPPRIVIAGRTNAGKSTLLNRLVGAERAITSTVPGTTRDYVEAEAALAGVPAVLVDTAGLRDAAGHVEREGVARARREAARADLVVYLLDAVEGVQADDEAALAALGDRALVAWNKVDAAARRTAGQAGRGTPACLAATRRGARDAPAISALTGEGVEALTAAILERLGWRPPAPGAAVPFTAGQAHALEAARKALADRRTNEARAHLAALLA
jgi:tRNA modification GTPase